jgi:hypothetical protein
MRRLSLSAPAFLAVALAATPSLQAAEPAAQPLPSPRVRVVLNGIGAFTNLSFGDTRQYAEYAETTSVSTSYSMKTAFGPDVAVQLSLFRGLGVLVGYSLASRSESGRFEASRPHPLYLNRPRSLSGELTGYKYKEGALQLDLAYGRGSGRLDWSLFAGASVFQVEADLLNQLTFTDTYPYDELTLASAPATRIKASPTGFNVGGRLDYRFGRTFGAGVLVRYSTASVKLRANPDASEVSFDAGGLQAGAGLRLYF